MSKTGYAIDEARVWDWSLNNAELARIYNISRERVRQIREKLGIADPKIRGSKERNVITTVEKLRSGDSEITVDEIKSKIGVGQVISEPYLRSILAKHKIEFIHGNRKYPWEKINWNLPNITISDVWGIPYSDIVEFRNERNQGDALWERDSEDPRFLEEVELEQNKAKELELATLN